jgi:hypothetical protein
MKIKTYDVVSVRPHNRHDRRARVVTVRRDRHTSSDTRYTHSRVRVSAE